LKTLTDNAAWWFASTFVIGVRGESENPVQNRIHQGSPDTFVAMEGI
jgi:hypothetical protein